MQEREINCLPVVNVRGALVVSLGHAYPAA